MKSIEVVRLTADDDTCAAVLNIDTIFGMIPFLEYFHVADGQIVSIRVYYDPRPSCKVRPKPPPSRAGTLNKRALQFVYHSDWTTAPLA